MFEINAHFWVVTNWRGVLSASAEIPPPPLSPQKTVRQGVGRPQNIPKMQKNGTILRGGAGRGVKYFPLTPIV